MEIKKITEKVSVSPQISLGDMADIKKAGFRAIICNRPDGEGADQPSYAEIEKAAKKAGLEIAYVPVQSGMVTDENVTEFDTALKTLPRPVPRPRLSSTAWACRPREGRRRNPREKRRRS